jgi:hypothetical protein
MPFSRPFKPSSLLTFGAILIIFAFGFTLRYQAFARSVLQEYPNGDAAKYFLYAYNLTNFGIYGYGEFALLPADADNVAVQSRIRPDAIVTPSYPLYLSLFFGGEYSQSQRDNARLGQVILSSLTILLAYAAFAPFGRTYGLAIATLVAMSPHLINMNLFLLTETLFCFFLMSFVLVLSRLNTDTRLSWFFIAGLLLALATLTRPWILGYIFFLLGYLLVSKLHFTLRQTVIVFIGVALVFTPWFVRNSMVSGEAADPSLLTKSVHHGMYPDMMYEDLPESLGYPYKFDPMSPELDESLSLTLTEIVHRAKVEPLKYTDWYLIGKIKTMLSWNILQGAHPFIVYQVEDSPYFQSPKFYISAYYMEKIHGTLMVMGLLGLLLVWLPGSLQNRSIKEIFFLRAISLMTIYFLLMHIVVAPFPRYSIPMRPIFYAMALYPIVLAVRIGWTGEFKLAVKKLLHSN